LDIVVMCLTLAFLSALTCSLRSARAVPPTRAAPRNGLEVFEGDIYVAFVLSM
jgi:hypothetical protein